MILIFHACFPSFFAVYSSSLFSLTSHSSELFLMNWSSVNHQKVPIYKISFLYSLHSSPRNKIQHSIYSRVDMHDSQIKAMYLLISKHSKISLLSMKHEGKINSEEKPMTLSDFLGKHSKMNSGRHSSSSVDTVVLNTRNVCGISGSVMRLSVHHQDIANISSDSRSIYSMRRQKKSTIRIRNTENISYGFSKMLISMDGIRAIKMENIRMLMRSSHGTGGTSEYLLLRDWSSSICPTLSIYDLSESWLFGRDNYRFFLKQLSIWSSTIPVACMKA